MALVLTLKVVPGTIPKPATNRLVVAPCEISVPVLPAEQFKVVAVACVHCPTATIEIPVSVTVAEADFEVSAWLVAVTVMVLTEFRAGRLMLVPCTLAPGLTVISWGAATADTVVAAGAV